MLHTRIQHSGRKRPAACVAGLLLLLASLLSAPSPVYAAGVSRIRQRIIGPEVAPHKGYVRIPVIVVGQPGTLPEGLRSFLRNELDAQTFRDYWRTSSIGRYDPHVALLEWTPKQGVVPAPDFGKDVPDVKAVMTYVTGMYDELRARKLLAPEWFDVTGASGYPDNYMDGAIFIVPGYRGARVYPTQKFRDKDKSSEIMSGPVVVAGTDVTAAELLRVFGQLIDVVPDHGSASSTGVMLCTSLANEGDIGFPMLDAFLRVRAGWADVVDLTGKARQLLLLPVRTTGKVYFIGRQEEFFLIENRAPGGGYDLSLRGAGLAVYHVDVTPFDKRKKSEYRPEAVSEPADSSFDLQNGRACNPARYIFDEGDAIFPDYGNQNPASVRNLRLNSNWNNGEPSDIVIKSIDTKTHYPLVTAVIGTE